MNATLLHMLARDATRFLLTRQTSGKPFGHFNQCEHAVVDDEVSALTVGLELWRMLNLPLSKGDLRYTRQRLQNMQCPETGLLIDTSWNGRVRPEGAPMLVSGDSFFTRCAVCALSAWGMQLLHPVAYLQALTPAQFIPCLYWGRGGHAPFSLGDVAVLLHHNLERDVPGAECLYRSFLEAVRDKQDPSTGLWLTGNSAEALTPSINFTFHTILYSFNHRGLPLPLATRLLDSCLTACRDERHYGWDTGYACNDLDLALVLYSASFQSGYRTEEIREWARERLPMMLDVQKPDGGFSFYHERAMDRHCHIEVSSSEPEGDVWGTLMYLGTIGMMVRMGYPDLDVPWGFSKVHRIRS